MVVRQKWCRIEKDPSVKRLAETFWTPCTHGVGELATGPAAAPAKTEAATEAPTTTAAVAQDYGGATSAAPNPSASAAVS